MTTMIPYRNGHGLMPSLLGWDPVRIFDQSPMKLEEHEDGVTATLDMPGVDPEDVDLMFEAGTLSICGRRGERVYNYTLALSDAIDPDTIQARLDKGVLTVSAGKRPEAKPRKIQLAQAQAESKRLGESKGEGEGEGEGKGEAK